MRPFDDVITFDVARAILDRNQPGRPSITSRPFCSPRRTAGCSQQTSSPGRCATVFPGRDGRLRRARARHPRRVAIAPTHGHPRGRPLHGPGLNARCRRRGVHRDIHGRASARWRRRGRHGEETAADGDVVRIFAEAQPQQNVGRRGADIQTGQIVVSAGETLNSSRIGAVAAVGVPQVEVYERPRVAILSTGNEIVEPGEVLRPGISTTSTDSRLAQSFRKTAEFHARIPPLRTRSTRCSRHSTRCWTTTSSSFLEGALLDERDSFAMRSPPRESCYFTA